MTKKSQIIFMDGKEIALDSLFNGEDGAFGYLAIGYSSEDDNGFEDPKENPTATNIDPGFKEINITNIPSYKRIALQAVSGSAEKDPDTGKVLKKYQAILDTDNISTSQNINQIAVVDSATPNDADTNIYSATTFPTFNKTSESSITFIIGFRL